MSGTTMSDYLQGCLMSCNRCGNTNLKVYHLPIVLEQDHKEIEKKNLITKIICDECKYILINNLITIKDIT